MQKIYFLVKAFEFHASDQQDCRIASASKNRCFEESVLQRIGASKNRCFKCRKHSANIFSCDPCDECDPCDACDECDACDA